MAKLLLIDGNSVLNRAYYALSGSNSLVTSGGIHTNGIFGFLNIIDKYIHEEKPGYVSVAFDLRAPTFRHKAYKEYKANRKGMPDELAEQVPILKEVLDYMNINRVECEGFEADDIIGTISKLSDNDGIETVILTGDRDALQLVSENVHILVPTTKRGKTETERYTPEIVMDKYGLEPRNLIDVKGLMGDSSDNIPGVKGVGEKTALNLIIEYGSIEKLYENVENITKKALKEKLVNDKEIAYLSRELATINRDIEDIYDLDNFKLKEYNGEKLYQIFNRLEFYSFIDKYDLRKFEVKYEEDVKVTSINDLSTIKKEIISDSQFSFYCLLKKEAVFSNKLSGIAISTINNTYYFDLVNNMYEGIFINEMKDIFVNEDIKKYSFAIKDFMVYLMERSIYIKGYDFDVQLGQYLLNPVSKLNEIAGVYKEYSNENINLLEDLLGKGKKKKRIDELLVDVVAKYAGTNSRVIYDIKDKISKKLEENDQLDLYYKIELPLQLVLAEMEFNGIKIKESELDDISEKLSINILNSEEKIYELAGEEFNINSPKQLGVILFEKLGLPTNKKNKTGYSTDVEVLESIIDKHDIIKELLEYRQLMKLKSTYVDGLKAVINKNTGRIHSNFNQTITATGRISSTEPNLQNIPIKIESAREIRKAFITEKNYTLLAADYSQIELRIFAHLSEDENMVNAFKDNLDIHKRTAAKVFKIEEDKVTTLMRSRAKAVNFGIVYGISDFGLAKDLGIQKKEAKVYIEEYFNNFPGVKEYIDNIVAEASETGYVKTIYNRRRYLPELKSSNYHTRAFGQRIAMNTPIQGSSADIIKVAMVDIYKKLKEKKLKTKMILQVHDELIFELKDDERELVIDIIKTSMENAIELIVPLVVDIGEGNSWYETK